MITYQWTVYPVLALELTRALYPKGGLETYMRRYETMVIIDPDLSSEDRDSLFERIKDLISKQEGFLVLFDEWGTQKLAYEIKKKIRGHYVRIDYCGTGLLVSEMERSFRIDDRILKYMTVLLAKTIDLEGLKEEVAETEKKEEEEKEKETPPTQDDAVETPPTQDDAVETPAEETEKKEDAAENTEAAESQKDEPENLETKEKEE